MLTRQLALVCEPASNKRIKFRQMASVSSAIQKQITVDFAPIWGISATIDPFDSLDDVPLGYWPIIVADDIHTAGAAGVHEDRMGQPFSLVQAGELWSLTASHEALEMLADPFGNRTVAGPAPIAFGSNEPSSTVEFLVERCDPCEDLHNAYRVNDIPVSDFYTPHYFDERKATGVRYDFAGHIGGPREVLTNGYLSWHSPIDDQWYQSRGFGPNPFQPVRLGKLSGGSNSMRSIIDAATPTPLETEGLDPANSRLVTCGLVCVGCAMFREALRSGRLLDGGSQLMRDGGPLVPIDGMKKDAIALRKDIEGVKRALGRNPSRKAGLVVADGGPLVPIGRKKMGIPAASKPATKGTKRRKN